MNANPSLVGSLGLVTFSPSTTFCSATALPPSLLNVTLYLTIFFHLAIKVIFLVILVLLKSNLVSFKYHPKNVYPSFFGAVGSVAFLFSITL